MSCGYFSRLFLAGVMMRGKDSRKQRLSSLLYHQKPQSHLLDNFTPEMRLRVAASYPIGHAELVIPEHPICILAS